MTFPSGKPKAVEFLNPDELYDPTPNGYSHVARGPLGRTLVIVSGQGGEDRQGKLRDDFSAQTQQALANLKSALDHAVVAPSSVAKLTILIVDHTEERLGRFNQELQKAFGKDFRPASTLIPVPRLALDGMLVEIEATAIA